MSEWIAIGIATTGIGLWLFSHVLEFLRPRPKTPTSLRWNAGIAIVRTYPTTQLEGGRTE
ncbi:MAG: hypothetical protein ABL973_17370 [Micropepsaceae bacterium]